MTSHSESKVGRVKWVTDPKVSFAEQVAAADQPLVLENTAASVWPAMKDWTNEKLVARLTASGTVLDGVKVNKVGSVPFRYFHRAEMNAVPEMVEEYKETAFTKHSMTAAEYFKRAATGAGAGAGAGGAEGGEELGVGKEGEDAIKSGSCSAANSNDDCDQRESKSKSKSKLERVGASPSPSSTATAAAAAAAAAASGSSSSSDIKRGDFPPQQLPLHREGMGYSWAGKLDDWGPSFVADAVPLDPLMVTTPPPSPPHPLRYVLARGHRREVRRTPSVPSRFGSKLPLPLYADVRLQFPMTHRTGALPWV